MWRDREGLRAGTLRPGKCLLVKEHGPTAQDGTGMPMTQWGMCAWDGQHRAPITAGSGLRRGDRLPHPRCGHLEQHIGWRVSYT